eukprot:TRINITY_DN8342_c0_g1_i1.p1 TRINITY_DN8342_c0_g1~~TRINITY_DN8342_c0_g1_i1.p1  ORF type:complete len:459 (+),score=81.73 TRINITY_DN8342_c0_g1_i1:169-1545(+)
MSLSEGVDLLRQGLVTGIAGLMAGGEGDIDTTQASFITFNQDTTCVAVGTTSGYSLYTLNSTDALEPVYQSDEPDVYIAERLFSSSLVAVVSSSNPRTLRVCHFKKGTEICRYSYGDRIRAVRMNRSRLVVCLEESLYIHNIRDMKVIHTIRDTPPNPSGLISLSCDNTHCYLAYPGHSHTGELQIFDTINLASRVIIPAHEGQLAALQFSPTGTRIATASEKGTVIRVFSTHDGSKLYELRRGLKRTASIYSLSFSPCGSFLACSSNTETIHVFKLDDKPTQTPALAGSPPSDDGWFGYINTMVSASAGYLPSQVTDTLLQGRAFASVHHNQTGTKTICALAMIRKSLRLLICNDEGFLHMYSLDQDEGGDCSLIKQFKLVESPTIVDQNEFLETTETPEKQDAVVSYSDKLKNRTGNEMTDSEKFHEMASAAETPPKTCFLLDDDGEFPPVAFAAS